MQQDKEGNGEGRKLEAGQGNSWREEGPKAWELTQEKANDQGSEGAAMGPFPTSRSPVAALWGGIFPCFPSGLNQDPV